VSTKAVYLVGSTASGKSAVALALAERLAGEIISVDSMQVYRGLNIGTAKPTREESARVPHHLIDVAELTEPFDVAKFIELARRAESEMNSRQCVPIFCGGTGLYLKAYFEGLGVAPSGDAALRTQLEATPLPALLAELRERDLPAFERIDKNNPRRVVRAVEVIRLTGKPFSAQRAEWQAPESRQKVFGLSRDASDLRTRIDARVDEMFARGLVEETRGLLARGLERNAAAMQAIGYRQVVEHLRGERPLDETIALVKTKTRQFAKRQMTWFRRQLAVDWIEVAPHAEATDIVEIIANRRA
jgi:tRNA dimethylallyltransferase